MKGIATGLQARRLARRDLLWGRRRATAARRLLRRLLLSLLRLLRLLRLRLLGLLGAPRDIGPLAGGGVEFHAWVFGLGRRWSLRLLRDASGVYIWRHRAAAT